ncbi:MAG TPA: serine/threonine-protein kinase, partial [Polyangiaceae bacterium]|nr:serine/threonine-protein kinase [Polyangiaceae bacterium]
MQLREVGQVLAGKYRLMRLLGQGRRGAVWQAQHLTLNAPVALKLFDSGQLDAAAEQQFLNEARTAAALRSPHVVQILDYGIAEHTPHIAMELLEGESLAARLERVGHLSPEETARVVQQVGRALARAHDAGVIHGDLKASNVFIVKNDDEELVQVLGFGVAKGERQLLDGPSAVGAGSRELLGAPEYVSPEQLDASAPVDSRGDLWSLGVLAYHCLLGELPFRGESAVDVVPAICSQAPPVPSTRGSVPDGFDDWFARACAPEREARFGSAREAAAAFAALSPGEPGVDSRPARALNTAAGPLPAPSELAVAAATDPCPPPSPPSRELEQRAGAGGSRWRHVMPLLVIAACGGAVFALRQHRVPPEGVTPPGSDGSTSRAASIVTASPALTPPRERVGRRSVAVISLLEPQGRSADAWLGTALADLLRTELESGDQLRTVSQERVGSMQRDLDLPPTQSLERPLLTQIRAILHADMTLIGSYWLLADSRELRINVTLQDTGSGETVATVAESGPASELFAVVSRIGAQVRRKLGADALSPAQLAQVERSLPSDPQARIWYAEGRAKLLRTEYLAATELFAQVAEREPAFPGSHAMAAEAWAALKYDSKAAAAAERARALSSELPRKEQLRAEARAHLRSNRAAQAAELLRSLVTVYPDELDFGIELVRAQARASQFSEASSTIAELHQLPAPLGEDPRIDLLEASVASYLGDQPRQGASARRAFEKAERLGLRSLQAEARVHEADVLFGTGRVREAREAYLDARRRAAEAHDLGGEANALSGLGELEGMTDTQGPEVGREHLQQAIEIYDRIGHLRNAGVAHVALGNAWWTAGRPAQAESEYRLALQRFEA